jgi:hypothetical protein
MGRGHRVPPSIEQQPGEELDSAGTRSKSWFSSSGRSWGGKSLARGALYHRTRFERIVERKLRNRQLTEDGNVELNGRDLRTPSRAAGQGAPSVYRWDEGALMAASSRLMIAEAEARLWRGWCAGQKVELAGGRFPLTEDQPAPRIPARDHKSGP